MKAFISVILAIGMACSIPLSLSAQNDPGKRQKKNLKEANREVMPFYQVRTLQLTKEQDGEVVTIDRAILDYQYSQWVEQMDWQFHMPTALRDQKNRGTGKLGPEKKEAIVEK